MKTAKIFAVFTALIMLISVFCACEKNVQIISSAPAASETALPETSKAETVSQTVSKKTSSKKKKNSVKSKKTTEKESESEVITESKEEAETVFSRKTASQTVSQGIKFTREDTLEVGMYHFSPLFTKNYGSTKTLALSEFSDVIKAGYVNSVIVSISEALNFDMLKLCKDYNISIWISPGRFDSRTQSIDAFMSSVGDTVDSLLSIEDFKPLVKGFHFDEPTYRGQSNADMLAEMKALYQRWGLRNFPVFGSSHLTAAYNNPGVPMDAYGDIRFRTESLKYATDIGYDCYWKEVYSDAGKDYVKLWLSRLIEITGHDTNIWFFPCGYTFYISSLSKRADEDYFLSQLEFYYELCKTTKNAAGMYIYTYSQFDNPDELGMQSVLVLKDENGKQKLRPTEEKYEKFSQRLKQICTEFKNTTVYPIEKVKE